MVNPPMACDICTESTSHLRQLYDTDLIAVANFLGFSTDSNYCDDCYHLIEVRQREMTQPDSIIVRSPTVESIDVSSQLPSQSSQPLHQLQVAQGTSSRRQTRLSERPLPFSPARSSPSSSSISRSSSSQPLVNPAPALPLDDTIDRLVMKKPRIERNRRDVISTHSLTFDNPGSSQDITKVPRMPSAKAQAPSRSSVQSDDSSLEASPQVAPMPKNRRMRPGPKQFATGTLELPSYVNTKVISSDLPRSISG